MVLTAFFYLIQREHSRGKLSFHCMVSLAEVKSIRIILKHFLGNFFSVRAEQLYFPPAGYIPKTRFLVETVLDSRFSLSATQLKLGNELCQ